VKTFVVILTSFFLLTAACSVPVSITLGATPLPVDREATLIALGVQQTLSALSLNPMGSIASTEAVLPPAVLLTEPVTQVATPLPAQSHLPTVTMKGGSGYIFSTGQATVDDRDIWWNALQFVPASGNRMVLLGQIGSPDNIQSVAFPKETPITLTISQGEGYAVELKRDGRVEYAILRVLAIDSEMAVTFDLVYPYLGEVIQIP